MSEVFDGDQFSGEVEEGPISYLYDYDLTRNNQTITLNIEVDYYPPVDGNVSYVDVLSANWGDYEFYLSPEEESEMADNLANEIEEELEKGDSQSP